MAIFPRVPVTQLPAPAPAPAISPQVVAAGLALDHGRDGYAANTVSAVGGYPFRLPLVSLMVPYPRPLLVDCRCENPGTPNAIAGVFEVAWSVGPNAFPTVRFIRGGPIVLVATSIAVVFAPQNGGYRVAGSIVPVENTLSVVSRPLYADLINNVGVNIAAAGSANFVLSPYTRRVRVQRTTQATTFKVQCGLTPGEIYVAANADMGWQEVVGSQAVLVNNTSAGADTFTVLEELGL